MAEQTRIEAVYTIRLENGAAVKELEKQVRELNNVKVAKAALTKENNVLIKEELALKKSIAESGVATKDQAQRLNELGASINKNTKDLALYGTTSKGLSGTIRELDNDLSGLTANGLRFRDKMAGAFATALDGTTAFQQLGQQTQKLETSLTAINSSIDLNGKQIAYLNEQLAKGAISEEQYANATDKLNKELEASKASSTLLTSELEKVTVQSDILDTKLAELNAEFNAGKISQEQYKQSLASIEAETRKTSEATGSLNDQFGKFVAGQGDQLKSSLSGIALQYVGVGAAVSGAVSLIKGAVDILAEFDKGLSGISALGGEYKANIDAIAEASKTAGIAFGFTATESLSAVEALAKAGVSTADILGGGLEGALTLAAAGELSVGDAAEIASKAMTQFGLAGSEVAHVADLLSNGANKATGDVSDFGQALNQSGQVASQFGVSIEETVGTLTAFASAGLVGSDAGTSLRTMLIRLAKPSEEAAATMERLGIKTFDAQGKFIGIEGVAEQLKNGLQDLTEEQRASALATIFGTDAIRSASILYKEGGEGVAKWTEGVSESGTAAQVAADKMNNLAGDLNELQAEYAALILEGGGFNDFLRRSVQILTETVRGFGDAEGALETLYAAYEPFTLGGLVNRGLQAIGVIDLAESPKKATEAIKETVKTTEELTAELEKQLNLQASFRAQGKEDAAAEGQPKIDALKELIGFRQTAIGFAQEQGREEALAAEKAAEIESKTIRARRVALEEQLKGAKADRENLNATDEKGIAIKDKLIASIEKEISALDGKTEKVKGESKAQKEANDLAQKRIELAKELADIATAQNQTPQQREEQEATNTRDERVAIAGNDAELLLQIEVVYQARLAEIRKQYADEYIATLTSAEGGLAAAKQASADQEFAALQKKHAAELAEVEKQGGDVATLLAQQAQEQTTFVVESRSGEESALTAAFDAEYAALDGNLIAQYDRTEQYETELAALRAKYREEDVEGATVAAKTIEEIERQKQENTLAATSNLLTSLQGVVDAGNDRRIQQQNDLVVTLKENLENANTQAEKDQIQAQIDSAEREKGALEKRKKDQKGFAIAAALINTYLAASSAFATTTPQYPAGVIAAAAAVISGLAMVAKISGFAQGGEVGKDGKSGTVTHAWGQRVNRPNGDNVLVKTDTGMATLRTGEKVLNVKQQKALEDRVGPSVWGAIGLPGHTYTPFTLRPKQIYQQAFADGGVVGIVSPRPSSSTIVQNQLSGSIDRLSERPIVTDIREVVSALDRRTTISEATSL